MNLQTFNLIATASAGVQDSGVGFGTLIAIVVCTIVTSFVCSLCEAALYAVSRARVEQLADSGSPRGRRLQKLREDIGKPIAAILTLNTISNTVGATLAGWVAADLFDSVGVGVFSGVFTLGILYLSEIIPKTVGVVYADALAPHLAGVVQWMILGLRPLVWAGQLVSRLLPKAGGSGRMIEEDLLALARLGHRAGTLRADEARWVQNALNLDRLKVSDILTPRTVVASIPQDTLIADAWRMLMDRRHSRVPVTEEGDLDRITGIVLRCDVHDADAVGKGDRAVGEIMRPPTFVPETMRVSDLLAKFLRERRHLFIVADEYGGTEGVVTLEDALEALLGTEIVDESDREADLQRAARRKAAERLEAAQSTQDKERTSPGP